MAILCREQSQRICAARSNRAHGGGYATTGDAFPITTTTAADLVGGGGASLNQWRCQMTEFTPPAEGILLAHFIVSDDVERSRRFYT